MTLEAVRPGRRDLERVVVAALAVAAVCVVASSTQALDLAVYRVGGQTWLQGLDLYSPTFPAPLDGPGLPFTYPPIAAVLFSVLAVLPQVVASGLVGLATVTAVAVTLQVAWRATARPPLTLLQLAGSTLLACVALEPLRSTIEFGQINVLLMALVVVDCLVLPPRWRGVLVGVAASIKLVPLGFLLYFLARRDWRACGRCVGAVAAMTAVAVVLAPGDSWTYWTSVLLDPTRIGNPGWITNQSVAGVLARGIGAPPVSTLLWALAAAVLAGMAWFAAHRLLERGQQLAAVVVVADWCLLVSPVSWSHHWVWVLPGLVALSDPRSGRARSRAAVAAGVVVVFVAAPWSWSALMTNDSRTWSAGELAYGNLYVWAGLAVLVVAVLSGTAAGRGRRPSPVRMPAQRG